MNTVEQLEAARALISDPEKWTKGALARDRIGRECLSHTTQAVCWCSIGALQAVLVGSNEPINDYSPCEDFLDMAADELRMMSIVTFNDDDDTTHADVMHAYDLAIELAKADQS